MKKVFTLIVAAVMAASVNAQTLWKASGEVSPIPAGTELINDGGLTIKTVYATSAFKEKATVGGEEFSGYFQLRTDKDPTTEFPTGTEKAGSSSLVVVAEKNVTLTFYGRRQFDGTNLKENDGKDLLMINQKNVTEKLLATEFNCTPFADGKYAYFEKTYSLEPGTYTVFRAGSTMKIYGIKYAFESATVTIGTEGVATFAAPFAVDYSSVDGLEAYSVNYDATNNKLTFNKIDGVVAANTAVIVKGAAGDYTLAKATADATVTNTGLKASDGKKTGAENIYCLANKSEGLGFYQVSSTVTIPANKAYLEIPASAGARTFYSMEFGGGTTGINTILANGAKANAAIYSLSGQQVSKAYKGIVIVNGKKMIQK